MNLEAANRHNKPYLTHLRKEQVRHAYNEANKWGLGENYLERTRLIALKHGIELEPVYPTIKVYGEKIIDINKTVQRLKRNSKG